MLERLNLQELREVCTELTYDFLSSTEEQFFQDSSYVDFNSDYPTPMDMVYKETQDTIEENKQRIKMFDYINLFSFLPHSLLFFLHLFYLNNSVFD